MLVLQNQQTSSVSPTLEPYSALVRPFRCHRRKPTTIILVVDEQTHIPNSILFPTQVPIELFQTVFATRGLQVGVRTGFVREELLDLQYLFMILAICVIRTILTLGASTHSWLGVGRYCIGCLSCTFWKSCNDTHCFCGRHLRRRRIFWVFHTGPRFRPFVFW